MNRHCMILFYCIYRFYSQIVPPLQIADVHFIFHEEASIKYYYIEISIIHVLKIFIMHTITNSVIAIIREVI